MKQRNGNCNSGKPVCKKGYVYKCPANISGLHPDNCQDKILDLIINEQNKIIALKAFTAANFAGRFFSANS